jgi:hypothetical protein
LAVALKMASSASRSVAEQWRPFVPGRMNRKQVWDAMLMELE